MRSLHGGFAGWLNRKQGTLGPVFADRHRLIAAPTSAALRLLAYVHNNPVRARQCNTAWESAWTSHRCYLDRVEAPGWLAVNRGLELSGFASTVEGRQAFDAQVRLLAAGDDEATLSGEDLVALRARLRRGLGAVEMGTPYVAGAGERRCDLYAPQSAALYPRWEGSVLELLDLVAAHSGVTVAELRSRDKSRRLVRARRLALQVHATHLHRPQVEMALALGLSTTAASYLLHRRLPEDQSSDLRREALAIAEACRRRQPSDQDQTRECGKP